MGNKLSSKEHDYVELLKSASFGQVHLLVPLEHDIPGLKALLSQIAQVDKTYTGGIQGYISRARKLLQNSRDNVNSFEGYKAEAPAGVNLEIGSDEFTEFENLGTANVGDMCFVLVAGGLGERLGYNGSKIGMPIEMTTRTSFLEQYTKYILAFESIANNRSNKGIRIPLAIMTSDDTHELTVALLNDNKYYGLESSQVTLLKQDKVPALLDNEAKIATVEGDPTRIVTKPHGHGDVHSLLHKAKLPEKWTVEGRKWVFFFQDTNSLAFRSLLAVLGVSVSRDFSMNSVAVPRKPGEAAGAICKLVSTSNDDAHRQNTMTLNVEYNLLDPLLRQSGFPDGDKPDSEKSDGHSSFPGNTNGLLFKLERYAAVLADTGGVVPEFVNPKYKDSERTLFKSPARLESLMQDFPRLFDSTIDKVGFTQMERWLCFSAVKNNVKDAAAKSAQGLPCESAFSGEADAYSTSARMFKLAAKAAECILSFPEEKRVTFLGITESLGPKIVTFPSWGTSFEEMKSRFKKGGNVSLSEKSTLVLEGDVEIHNLYLDGTLIIRAMPGAKVVVEDAHVQNAGWLLTPLAEDSEGSTPATEVTRLRGYTIDKREQEEHIVESGQFKRIAR